MKRLPERDPKLPATHQGAFRKYNVSRADGKDAPGGSHEGDEYFVINLTRDAHAAAAIHAYADSCLTTHPQLSIELVRMLEAREKGNSI